MHKTIAYFKTLSPILNNGNMDILIGEHYLSVMEWGRARQVLEAGIAKGNLKDPGGANALLEKAIKEMTQGGSGSTAQNWVPDW